MGLSLLNKKVLELNQVLGNPEVPWTPEGKYVKGCLSLDYYQPGDSKIPYQLQESLERGGSHNVSDKMSAHDMSRFLDGAIFSANKMWKKE